MQEQAEMNVIFNCIKLLNRPTPESRDGFFQDLSMFRELYGDENKYIRIVVFETLMGLSPRP